MRLLSKRGATTLVVLILVLGLAAWASHGREFSGIFETKNPVESGTDVILTFEVQIGNHCGEDVLGATVKLGGAIDLVSEYATWTAVDITADGSVDLSSEITISAEEHDVWTTGGLPMLTIEFQDAGGETRQHMVELASAVVEEVPA
jgi:hypothetical protein